MSIYAFSVFCTHKISAVCEKKNNLNSVSGKCLANKLMLQITLICVNPDIVHFSFKSILNLTLQHCCIIIYAWNTNKLSISFTHLREHWGFFTMASHCLQPWRPAQLLLETLRYQSLLRIQQLGPRHQVTSKSQITKLCQML